VETCLGPGVEGQGGCWTLWEHNFSRLQEWWASLSTASNVLPGSLESIEVGPAQIEDGAVLVPVTFGPRPLEDSVPTHDRSPDWLEVGLASTDAHGEGRSEDYPFVVRACAPPNAGRYWPPPQLQCILSWNRFQTQGPGPSLVTAPGCEMDLLASGPAIADPSRPAPAAMAPTDDRNWPLAEGWSIRLRARDYWLLHDEGPPLALQTISDSQTCGLLWRARALTLWDAAFRALGVLWWFVVTAVGLEAEIRSGVPRPLGRRLVHWVWTSGALALVAGAAWLLPRPSAWWWVAPLAAGILAWLNMGLGSGKASMGRSAPAAFLATLLFAACQAVWHVVPPREVGAGELPAYLFVGALAAIFGAAGYRSRAVCNGGVALARQALGPLAAGPQPTGSEPLARAEASGAELLLRRVLWVDVALLVGLKALLWPRASIADPGQVLGPSVLYEALGLAFLFLATANTLGALLSSRVGRPKPPAAKPRRRHWTVRGTRDRREGGPEAPSPARLRTGPQFLATLRKVIAPRALRGAQPRPTTPEAAGRTAQTARPTDGWPHVKATLYTALAGSVAAAIAPPCTPPPPEDLVVGAYRTLAWVASCLPVVLVRWGAARSLVATRRLWVSADDLPGTRGLTSMADTWGQLRAGLRWRVAVLVLGFILEYHQPGSDLIALVVKTIPS